MTGQAGGPAPGLGAGPIVIPGGADAVLLCHGFTGSPATMAPWAEDLGRRSYTVHVPLLPGHGTRWEDMEAVPWTAWYARVDETCRELLRDHRHVFVGGLSMGGSLALLLAARHRRLAGVVLVNPAVASHDPRHGAASMLWPVVRSWPGIGSDIAQPGRVEPAYPRTPLRAVATLRRLWREVGANLGAVDQPLLCFRSKVDHVVDSASLTRILTRIGSADVTVRLLPRSYHVATLDHDAGMIASESARWLAAHGGGEAT